MKTFFSLFFSIWCFSSMYSQKATSFQLNGSVYADSLQIENAHIINKSSLVGTISNSDGMFTLPVSIGDTLFVSHINFESANIRITKAILASKKVNIALQAKTHTLQEVTIKKRRSIFYVDPQIMPESMAHPVTLKLPFANVKAKAPNKNILRPESGLSVNLVSLIHAFNGKRKKMKELKNAKIKDQKLDNLRKQFQDSFFYVDLQIRDGYINQFLQYCIDEGIFKYTGKNNILKLTHYLIQKSQTFHHKKIDQDSLLSKQ